MFVPLGDLLVVRRSDSPKATPGGLTIPDRYQPLATDGEVLAVSEGYYDAMGNFRALRVTVGDRVFFGMNAGLTVKLDGEDLFLMHENELFGVILPESANAKAA